MLNYSVFVAIEIHDCHYQAVAPIAAKASNPSWISGVFTQDEKSFLAGSAHRVSSDAERSCCLWNVESGEAIHTIPHPTAISKTCFSPDEEYLLTACLDGQVRVFDRVSGKLVGVATHNSDVLDAQFFGGPDLIITGCSDRACRIWEWRTGAQVTSQPVGELGGGIRQIDVSENEIRLFGGGGNSLAFPLPRRQGSDSIEFFQWCTGRQWQSVDQSPVVLTSNQWMELWQQRSETLEKKEVPQRSGPRPLSESLIYLEKSFESADAFRQNVDVVSRLSKVNRFFDHSSMESTLDGKVVSLEISCRDVRGLSQVSRLTDLQRLDLRGSTFAGGIADITFVRSLTKLESFSCNKKIRDLSPFGPLTLTELEIWMCGHSDLSPLAGLQLTRLNIGGGPLRDLSALKGMPLEYLCINSTDVSDLSPLEGMPLKTLMLAKTRVTDLTPLDGMQIEFLAINSGTKIGDLDQIRQFPLTDLHIDNPQDHIESFPKLERLNHKPIADFQQD